VYRRAGYEIRETPKAKLTVVDAPLLQISATGIREMIKQNCSIRYLVPDSVKEEIERNHYYR
jgi:nicotinate-nucleotide adenylyltransferase